MQTKVRNLIMVGDRVLIKPSSAPNKTKSGLYLPPGVQEKEKIQSGTIVAVGPGYPIPSDGIDDEWKSQEERLTYMPLQAQEGDTALFVLSEAYEIMYRDEKYYVVAQDDILMLERDNEFFQ
ncbi:co-chaperone GroES [Ornithobacterium rhinotracheale]|uniref:co-chaperone GroES n=1 Tax=Ornithobacterium rhinotracheale TaxID=28251 RepID=UPI0040365977